MKKGKMPLQFLQFSIIGLVNAGIDIGTLNLLLLLFPTDDQYLLVLYNTIAYILAVSNSYYWNAKITFRYTAEGNYWQRFTFIFQALVSLGISNLIFIVGSYFLGYTGIPSWFTYNLAKGLAMGLSSFTSFLMIKFIVFNEFKIIRIKD
jgi:putative flippase GtrA